jgi:hypothetical protein
LPAYPIGFQHDHFGQAALQFVSDVDAGQFSAFLSNHDPTQRQMVFGERVVNYVVRNGVLKLKRLQDEPF